MHVGDFLNGILKKAILEEAVSYKLQVMCNSKQSKAYIWKGDREIVTLLCFSNSQVSSALYNVWRTIGTCKNVTF